MRLSTRGSTSGSTGADEGPATPAGVDTTAAKDLQNLGAGVEDAGVGGMDLGDSNIGNSSSSAHLIALKRVSISIAGGKTNFFPFKTPSNTGSSTAVILICLSELRFNMRLNQSRIAWTHSRR